MEGELVGAVRLDFCRQDRLGIVAGRDIALPGRHAHERIDFAGGPVRSDFHPVSACLDPKLKRAVLNRAAVRHRFTAFRDKTDPAFRDRLAIQGYRAGNSRKCRDGYAGPGQPV